MSDPDEASPAGREGSAPDRRQPPHGPDGTAVPLIRVYVRDGCHLCDQAMTLLTPLAAEHGAVLEAVDIEADDELHGRYLERIPVIELDGAELYDFFVDAADLRARLAGAAGR